MFRSLKSYLIFIFSWTSSSIGLDLNAQNILNQDDITIDNVLERLVKLNSISDKINCFQEDTLGNIWIGTNSGLYQYDGQKVDHIYNHEEGLLSISVRGMQLDDNGHLWIGGLGYGIQEFNPYTKKFITYEIPIDLKKYPSRPYHLSKNYDSQYLLCAMDRSFGLFSLKEKRFTEVIHSGMAKRSAGFGFVRYIEADPLDKYIWWLGSTGGLFKYDSRDTSFVKIAHEDGHLNGLVHAFCFDKRGRLIYSDNQGAIYACDRNLKSEKIIDLSKRLIPDVITMFGDDLMIGGRTSSTTVVKDFYGKPKLIEKDNEAEYVTCTFKDSKDRIWLGHKEGYSVFNPKYNIVSKYDIQSVLSRFSLILAAEQWKKDSDIYVAPARNEGLIVVDIQTREVKVKIPKGLTNGKRFLVKGLSFDNAGMLWVSSNLGLFKYDPNTSTFTNQHLNSERKKLYLGKIKWKEDGTLILHAYRPQRLIYYETSSGESQEFPIIGDDADCQISLLRQFRYFDINNTGDVWIAGRPSILNFNDGCYEEYHLPDTFNIDVLGAKCIDLDGKNNLFIGYGTKGLIKVNLTGNPREHTYYSMENGMPSDRVQNIESDDLGATWIASGTGITYSKDLNKFEKIALPNIEDEDYFDDPRSFSKMYSGNIVFGGNHSVMTLDVEKAYMNLSRHRPLFQSIGWTDHEPITLRNKYNPIIEIPFQHQSIKIRFSDYDYGRPNPSTYQYRLANKTDKWQELSNAEIIFFDLPHGQYDIEITPKIGNLIDPQLVSKFSFHVSPPWYLTYWAVVIWTILGISLLYALFRILLRRQMVAQKLAHVEQVKELQNKLFTNITHELRTPLSLIIGSSNSISDHNIEKNKKSIVTNAQLLKNYVDQMLDLSSIDAGKLKMQKVQVDIIQQLRLIVEAFDSMAVGKEITIHQLYEESTLMMDTDVLSFRKIISNLVHNALKFTGKNGHIYVSAKQEIDQFFLSIKDTGGGIKEEHLPYIFDRYYKTFDLEENLGSGIGMALTKELVDLLGGNISVKSKYKQGTDFTITLPISLVAEKKVVSEVIAPLGSLAENDLLIDSNEEYKDTLLIVEDNAEMNSYIASLALDRFNVIQEYNGVDGLNSAINLSPTIIISDVMMPQMGGFEMVHLIKDDWRTCDIPIVLLTAKADKESKLEGLSEGADAYLAKPFDEEELRATIDNLIENRKRILNRKQETEDIATPVSQLEVEVLAVIHKYLQNPNLSVDFVAKQLNRSRTTLFREMKDELGITPSKFIKKVKLHKAIQLLKGSDIRINEVAYETGFNDPSYFTRIFKAEMGVSPQEFRDASEA